jgi:hypothetical protein
MPITIDHSENRKYMRNPRLAFRNRKSSTAFVGEARKRVKQFQIDIWICVKSFVKTNASS